MPNLKKRKGETKSQNSVRTEMTAMKKGQLHSGSKNGPKVTNPKQAIAIGLSEARKESGSSASAKPGKKVAGSKNTRAMADKMGKKRRSRNSGRH